MSFNSLEFILFLPIVFGLYWMLKDRLKEQNVLLLLASYFFYGWWDWRFLILIFISSIVDFNLGQRIQHCHDQGKERSAKNWMFLSLALNLGLLGFFKYYNFFIQSFISAFSVLGIPLHLETLSIILPVGISFYTFQTLSYTIDIYRKRMKPTNDWVIFFTFVAFFPQLVAGPIERASKMIPQFQKKKFFKYEEGVEGMRFILYGLFKKIVIADYCAHHTSDLFNNYEMYGGSDLLLGLWVFSVVWFYADFSAYSDIAIGVARLFGIKLTRNFAYPLFSRNIEEFWQRWHITMSKWFRDYLYLGMSRSKWKVLGKDILILIMFTAIGLWHGANWTFISWGFFNGAAFLFFLHLLKGNKRLSPKATLREIPRIFRAIFTIGFMLVFLISKDMPSAFGYFSNMFSSSLFSVPVKWNCLFIPFAMLIWEWNHRDHWHSIKLDHWPKWGRRCLYLFLLFLTLHFYGIENDFIYYQF